MPSEVLGSSFTGHYLRSSPGACWPASGQDDVVQLAVVSDRPWSFISKLCVLLDFLNVLSIDGGRKRRANDMELMAPHRAAVRTMAPSQTRRTRRSGESLRMAPGSAPRATVAVFVTWCLTSGHAWDPFGLGKTPQMGWNRRVLHIACPRRDPVSGNHASSMQRYLPSDCCTDDVC